MRYLQLDALRGMAAITVFLSHAIGLCPVMPIGWADLSESPFHMFFDGAAAVDLFFVLSGFCIALPYFRNDGIRPLKITSFLCRRVFRLYPAYLFAVFFALIVKVLYVYPGGDFMSSWGATFYSGTVLSLKDLLMIISLIGFFDANLLNPPSWSLTVEMRMVIVIPMLIYITKLKASNNIYIYILLLIGSRYFSFGGILTYIPLFLMGVTIAYNLDEINKFVNRINPFFYIIIFIGSLFCYSIAFPGRKLLLECFTEKSTEFIIRTIISFGSVGLIVCFFRESVVRFFSKKIGWFLGVISYSFYLVHFPILMITFAYIKNQSVFLIISLAAILSMGLAYIVYQYIELPLIRLGKKWSNKLFEEKRAGKFEF